MKAPQNLWHSTKWEHLPLNITKKSESYLFFAILGLEINVAKPMESEFSGTFTEQKLKFNIFFSMMVLQFPHFDKGIKN